VWEQVEMLEDETDLPATSSQFGCADLLLVGGVAVAMGTAVSAAPLIVDSFTFIRSLTRELVAPLRLTGARR
jgi:hypothetical protein